MRTHLIGHHRSVGPQRSTQAILFLSQGSENWLEWSADSSYIAFTANNGQFTDDEVYVAEAADETISGQFRKYDDVIKERHGFRGLESREFVSAVR